MNNDLSYDEIVKRLADWERSQKYTFLYYIDQMEEISADTFQRYIPDHYKIVIQNEIGSNFWHAECFDSNGWSVAIATATEEKTARARLAIQVVHQKVLS